MKANLLGLSPLVGGGLEAAHSLPSNDFTAPYAFLEWRLISVQINVLILYQAKWLPLKC